MEGFVYLRFFTEVPMIIISYAIFTNETTAILAIGILTAVFLLPIDDNGQDSADI